jgi:hypothetical protein
MIIGPPLGGAAIGLIGSVATITADALSYLLSALGIRMIGGRGSPPPKADGARPGFRDLPDSWATSSPMHGCDLSLSTSWS